MKNRKWSQTINLMQNNRQMKTYQGKYIIILTRLLNKITTKIKNHLMDFQIRLLKINLRYNLILHFNYIRKNLMKKKLLANNKTKLKNLIVKMNVDTLLNVVSILRKMINKILKINKHKIVKLKSNIKIQINVLFFEIFNYLKKT